MSSRSRQLSLQPEDMNCGPSLHWGRGDGRGNALHLQGACWGISAKPVWGHGVTRKGDRGLRKGCFLCRMEIRQRGDSGAGRSGSEV